MKMIHAAIAGAAASALLLIAPPAVTAQPHGGGHGAHTSHFGGHLRSGRLHSGFNRGAYGQWPLYGGIVSVPPFGPGNTINYAAPTTVIYVPEPPRALTLPSQPGHHHGSRGSGRNEQDYRHALLAGRAAPAHSWARDFGGGDRPRAEIFWRNAVAPLRHSAGFR